ncbi:MAG TPA: SGNH/GDSL hydrolase family protein [Bradyrhizobium sp.]|nr:SGNH/GDSL hydrolase family protein [Bradyrhizobium sp.]
MNGMRRPCDTHLDLFDFAPLLNFRRALKCNRKVKIVAIGSSSTAGADGILPYPPRLEMLLRQGFDGQKGFYGRMIDVLNRGIGGQEAPEELSRFESDVIGEVPALVIWQVGTNAVFRNEDYNPDEVKAAIEVGLDLLSGLPIDVVLMDSQYTRAVVEPAGKLDLSNNFTSMISEVAKDKGVNVFRRFALMQRWVEDEIPLKELDDGGDKQLHTSDWATNCVTQALFGAIKQAVT